MIRVMEDMPTGEMPMGVIAVMDTTDKVTGILVADTADQLVGTLTLAKEAMKEVVGEGPGAAMAGDGEKDRI